MPRSPFARFLIAYVVFLAGFPALFGVGLLGLDRFGRLPAPPFTATACIDEKFRFLHRARPLRPDLVAVGSSVTWRNLDFAHLPVAARPLNAATCYLHVHETGHLAAFAQAAWPSARTFLVVLAMRDFGSCAGRPDFFDLETAVDYAVRGRSAWWLYLTQLRLKPFVTDVLSLGEAEASGAVPLGMDRFGSSPLYLRPPDIREDVSVDPDCHAALRGLATRIEGSGRRLVVTLMPPMPAWIAAYDPGAVRDRAWRRAVADALDGTGAALIDAVGMPVHDAMFTDPAHFHGDSVPSFMAWLEPRLRAAIDPAAGTAGAPRPPPGRVGRADPLGG